MIWKIRDQGITFERPLLMGVLNTTPDSFSDGGTFLDAESAVRQALRLAEEGADILDLGAESTRPQAEPVTAGEECSRLLPALKKIRKMTDLLISIDTTKPEVAQACLDEGANIINDVSALAAGEGRMAALIRDYKAGLVLMHRRGTPGTMQSLARYGDVVEEVLSELRERVAFAVEKGVPQEAIAVDPGLGFAKEAPHNLELIRHLERFHAFERPVLIGPSRKSFIGKITGREDPSEREFGTAAVVAWAVLKGAHVIRVHEPGKMKDVVKMIQAIQERVSHVGT